jgi:CRP/FNR family transcriptional regulator, cyclic AMP receptor protein
MESEPNFLGLFSRERDVISLKVGECLFKKGDPAQSTMYVVLSGEVRIGDGNIILETVGPGSVVGEMALIDGSPRSATVKASADATLAAIDEKRFLFLVHQTPGFGLKVMRLLVGRLRKTTALVGI